MNNRRQSIRINGGNFPCKVILNGTTSNAIVIDESIHGVCVAGIELFILLEDQRIEVEFGDEHIIGRCRSASRDHLGSFRLGILKDDNEISSPNRMLINSYMDLGGCRVCCIPLCKVNDHQIRIRLLDGKEFEVNANQLVPSTRDERWEELNQNPEQAYQIRCIYAAMFEGVDFQGNSDVLDVEFGPSVETLIKL